MGELILLIDDDIDELYIFKEALTETNDLFECVYAETVETGLQVLKNLRPAYIFLDINMPRVNGLEGLALIKGNKAISKIPVILYSTAIDGEIVTKAKALGAAGCVCKTDSVKNLATTLKRVLIDVSTIQN